MDYNIPYIPLYTDDDTGDAFNAVKRETALWASPLHVHRAYNHENLQRMQRRVREGGIDRLSPTVKAAIMSAKDLECEHCQHGKALRRSLPPHPPPDKPSPKLHSDTWTAPRPSAFKKFKYAIIFIHELTDMWFVFGLRDHTSASSLQCFKTIVALTKSHKQAVTIFLCDNGREYVSSAFDAACSAEGIVRQFSTPHRQDQNGRSERAWRTLAEAVVTLLTQSGLPIEFWWLAMEAVVFCRNRLVSNPSPFERFFGRAPVLPALQPFGCLALHCNPSPFGVSCSRVFVYAG